MRAMSFIAGYRYPLPSYLCDSDQRLKPHAILHFFEDAAWRNAEELGFGYSQFYRLGRMWVLSRVRIEIDRYPKWQEELELRTWPAGMQKLFALRHFEAFSEAGRRCFGAATQWLLLDAERGRPIPPSRVFSDEFLAQIPDRKACATDPERLTAPEDGESAGELLAGYSAIDVNDHVNNAEFVRWCFDSVGTDFDELPHVIEIDFKSALSRNEPIRIVREPGAGPTEGGRSISRTVAVFATAREGFEENGGEAVSIVRFHGSAGA